MEMERPREAAGGGAMKTAKIFVIAAIALVLSLTFVLAGCEGGGDDGTSNNGYNENDSNGSGGEDTNGTLESGLIVATAPNDPSDQPFVGDFKFHDEIVCTNVSVCEFEWIKGTSGKVEFTHPLALFLTKIAYPGPGETEQVSWDQPGDWGLAPQGMYSNEEGSEYLVETKLSDGVVKLIIHDFVEFGASIDRANIIGDDGETKIGQISVDLTTITFTFADGFSPVFTHIE